jgi:hypothetical protein
MVGWLTCRLSAARVKLPSRGHREEGTKLGQAHAAAPEKAGILDEPDYRFIEYIDEKI